MIVHGLDLSYFTGKLEGYLRLKGLAYRFTAMNTAGFRAMGDRVGVRQMPHLTLPDGRLLTDTVTIIDTLESQREESSDHVGLTPNDPVAAFIAELVEAFADEHLWRPALYYRWAFDDDARQASRRLADTLMRDVGAPAPLKRLYILGRQRWYYLRGEGVGRDEAPVVEADYLALLDVLEPVFRRRGWLLGDAPTRADVGLFGPLFRHFLCDPTPGRIMRERAPATAAWALRVWAGQSHRPSCARGLVLSPTSIADLAPLFFLIVEHFLPEAVANARVCAEGRLRVTWTRGAAVFRYRANPYRAWRLDRLCRHHAALSASDRARVEAILGKTGVAHLSLMAGPSRASIQPGRTRDRWWRPL